MTTNKPKVVAYARTGALASILPHPWRLPVVSGWSPMYSDALIRLSDYEELQAECEQLRATLSEVATAVGAHADPSCSLEFMAEIPKEAKSVVGRLRNDAATEQQIQRAAKDLPEGWQINVGVEKDAAWVDVFDQDGANLAVDLTGSLAEQLGQAIDAAMAGGSQ